jgi:hypothetical protein
MHLNETGSGLSGSDSNEAFLDDSAVIKLQKPKGRRFGSVETVDAVGYLDAIEKVTSDTVVVVCIYRHLRMKRASSSSSLAEDWSPARGASSRVDFEL